MQEIKATAVIPTMEYVMFSHGKETYRKVLDLLSPSDQQMFKKRMLPGSWIPTKSFIRLNEAIIDVIWGGDRSHAFTLGYESADRGFGNFYKLFMRLGNPSMVASKASALFESIHRPGKQTLLENEKGIIRFVVGGFEDNYEIVYVRLAGYYKRVSELTGAKRVEVSWEDTSGNWSEVYFKVTYS